MRDRIDVSPEMLAFVGAGLVDAPDTLPDPVVVAYALGGDQVSSISLQPEAGAVDDARLVFLVTREACMRLFPDAPVEPGRWHLPADLKAVALEICRGEGSAHSRTTLQLAKSIELFHKTMSALEAGALLPAKDDLLGIVETGRIIAARRIIDERWNEPLTLNAIARATGTSRTQLTRGFRLMYDCTIGELLSRSRLEAAKDLIVRTETPIARIGYACGYRNNASFSRAFSKRFGVAPSEMRKAAA